MKLVINSNIHYKNPLKILFESILKSDINDFKNIIVVISQTDEYEPKLTKISEITNIDSDIEVITVGNTHNSYDYGGFNALWKYKEHHLIKSKTYLYIHDTCEVDSNFWSKTVQINHLLKLYTIVGYGDWSANIIAFTSKLISRYNNTFDTEISKSDAVLGEMGVMIKYKKLFMGFHSYMGYKKIENRKLLTKNSTKYSNRGRHAFYYESFGITKYVFMEYTGDISNKINLIFNHTNIKNTKSLDNT